MRRVLGRGNRTTEALVARLFREAGVTGWRRHLALPGRPDFAFRNQRVVLFIDGCFWHGCPRHLRIPAANRAYWVRKIARNVERDREIRRLLRARNWRVARIWEHDLTNERKQRRSLARVLPLLSR